MFPASCVLFVSFQRVCVLMLSRWGFAGEILLLVPLRGFRLQVPMYFPRQRTLAT